MKELLIVIILTINQGFNCKTYYNMHTQIFKQNDVLQIWNR